MTKIIQIEKNGGPEVLEIKEIEINYTNSVKSKDNGKSIFI